MNNSLLKSLLLCGALAAGFTASAQKPGLNPNWQNLDLKTDSVFGIGTEKTYLELLKGKKHKTVLVAVIDGGVDTAHEDLKSVLWNNPKEKAGDGKDNDKNGYIDDVHGWDFIGGANGNVHWDNLEMTRLVRAGELKYASVDSNMSAADLAKYHEYVAMRQKFGEELAKAKASLQGITAFKQAMDGVVAKIGKPNPTLADFQAFQPADEMETRIKTTIVGLLPKFKDYNDLVAQALQPGIDHYETQVKYNYNIDFDPRSIVGDNYANSVERNYGNNDVTGPDAGHGTHCAGIIGADRTNSLGMMGVADDVKIMSVRTVPDGDERDKDVANAIRYAAANGAKVLSMSYGKGYSWDKKAVDEAVKFAMSKDVLIIHAAGNDNKDLDLPSNKNFPLAKYEGGGEAANWIEIGASGPKDDKTLKASFSNYGKTSVDVFAPGVDIYSSIPGSKYGLKSGTSMATPVVAGLAALIRSYYPKLKAAQVKEIIMKSAVRVNHTVSIRDGASVKEVAFSDICRTGAIINAYEALKLAAAY